MIEVNILATQTANLKIKLIQPTDMFADETFNAVINDIDAKLVGIAHVDSKGHWDTWKASTKYEKDDIVRITDSKSNQYYQCIVAGTSDTLEPTNVTNGSLVVDGSATWKVMTIGAGGESNGISIWLSNNYYTKGQAVLYDNTLYRCKADHKAGTDFKSVSSLNGKKPNIILIMNESLADFSKLGKVNYNQDPLSYMHSLKDNTISGLDYVSVFGAGTSNSEFEAMTGNTMKFFPSGSNVYQQFMHDSTYSISSYLKSLGYSCDAVHPSSGTNWNRVNTYKSMKFDRFITIDEFKNPEYIRYISDKESYKKVISLYEEKKKKKQDNPMFVFDMTIQNHGGYLTNTNWDDPVTVNGAHYTEANEYLSSTKVSDDAFKYLIDYFKKADEPTIICMFGDHQPSIETEFYEDLLGKSQSDWELDDIQKRFATPFIIWANYDIQEGEDVVISNNYIENLLLKQAGIELPLYNKYVEKVTKTIPAMNVNGYMDKDGKWHKYDKTETEDVSKLLNDYETLQYGYYSDMDKDSTSKLFKMEK